MIKKISIGIVLLFNLFSVYLMYFMFDRGASNMEAAVLILLAIASSVIPLIIYGAASMLADEFKK